MISVSLSNNLQIKCLSQGEVKLWNISVFYIYKYNNLRCQIYFDIFLQGKKERLTVERPQ